MSLKHLKAWQVIVLLVIIVGVVFGGVKIFMGTSAPGNSALPLNTQLIAVQYGDVVNTVSASGSIVFPSRVRLAFDRSGTVRQVNVKAGSSVTAGQILAELKTDDWEDYLLTLEDQLTLAQRQLVTQERAVTAAERQIAAKEFSLRQAQLNLQTAENNLNDIELVRQAQDAVDSAQRELDFAQQMVIKSGVQGIELIYWTDLMNVAKARLAEAQQELKDILAGTSVKLTSDISLDIATKELQVDQARKQLEDAQFAIEDAMITVDDAKIAIEDARKAVEKAQKALDDAKNTSPTLKATSDGVVASTNIEVGQKVVADASVIEIVDTSVVEVSALVNEIDFPLVRGGQTVTLAMDALTDVQLTGEISMVSILGKAVSGVVSYPVTISVQPLAGVQLGEGMSATVTITLQSANNVLVIPNRAIGGTISNPTVSVMVNGQLQEIPVLLGMSDGTRTQVINGLKEGEMVLVASSSASQQSFFGGQGVVPGSGQIFRSFGGGR